MTPPSPAGRLLVAAARAQLQPLGLRRFGRSRQWIDDHGWWLCVIDFSASQWHQGSGLTVGAMWLWQDVDHLTFDVDERVAAIQPFRDEVQFAAIAADLADRARDKAIEFRGRFNQIDAVARYLTAQPVRRGHLWASYDAGIAAGLVGDTQAARDRFAAVLAEDAIAPWIVTAQQNARHLIDIVEDTNAFSHWVQDMVTTCRGKLHLTPPPTSAGILSAH